MDEGQRISLVYGYQRRSELLQSSTDQDAKATAVRIRGNTGQRLEQHVGMLVALMILLAWVGGMSMRANGTPAIPNHVLPPAAHPRPAQRVSC
jgi:hypothetical protein